MHEPVVVQLNRKEVLTAVEVATHKHVNAIGEHYQQMKAGAVTNWNEPINAALAQSAVTKWLNGRQNVRARVSDYGNLIISEFDSPGDLIALVSCMPPVFQVEGYIRVSDAQSKTDCLAQTMAGRRWWIHKKDLRDPRELGNG